MWFKQGDQWLNLEHAISVSIDSTRHVSIGFPSPLNFFSVGPFSTVEDAREWVSSLLIRDVAEFPA
jgi:hypothetical protein